MIKLLNEFLEYQEPSAGVNEEPEQETDIFGKYAFDTDREDVPEEEKEPHTRDELMALIALRSYMTTNRKSGLDKVAPQLVDLAKQGKYSPVLDPSGVSFVYRILSLSKEDASKLLGVEISHEAPSGKVGAGVLSPTKGSISGWTSDIHLVEDFHGATDQDDKNTLLLFKAPIKGNTFFGKPAALAMAVDPDMAHESETIAVGPVKYVACAYTMTWDAEFHPIPNAGMRLIGLLRGQ